MTLYVCGPNEFGMRSSNATQMLATDITLDIAKNSHDCGMKPS